MSFSNAAGHIAPTVIHTSADHLEQGRIDLPVQHGTIPAYYAAPQGKRNLPIVLVVQEIFGVHEHIQDVCRRLAKAGYLAIAADLYHRQGDASAYSDIPTLISKLVSKVSDEQVYADLDACIAWAQKNGGDSHRIGITGFCWGGRLTWMYAAHNPQIKAAVAWYGKLSTGHGPLIHTMVMDIAGALHAPVLGLYGAKDASIPLSDIQAMQQKLSQGNAHSQASEFVVYPDANHAFLADYRASYHPAAAQDGWRRMLAWFERYMA